MKRVHILSQSEGGEDLEMSEQVKMGLVIAGGLIAAALLLVYFSPHQSCVRSLEGMQVNAGYACTVAAGQNGQSGF